MLALVTTPSVAFLEVTNRLSLFILEQPSAKYLNLSGSSVTGAFTWDSDHISVSSTEVSVRHRA